MTNQIGSGRGTTGTRPTRTAIHNDGYPGYIPLRIRNPGGYRLKVEASSGGSRTGLNHGGTPRVGELIRQGSGTPTALTARDLGTLGVFLRI